MGSSFGDTTASRRIAPGRLRGRTKELERARAAWQRSTAGAVELLLISGDAGVGKSALIEALQREPNERGFFFSGKFDQAHRGQASNAVLQAANELVQHILSQDEMALEAWKVELSGGLGGLASVLCQSLPDLQIIVGPQSAPAQVSPADTKHRFGQALLQLFACCSRQEPLLLFLDDVHWGDSSAAEIVLAMLRSTEIDRLLIVAAYRPDESDCDGFLTRLRSEPDSNGAPMPTKIELGNLDVDALSELAADACALESGPAAALATILISKTAGNPLFFLGLLRHLAALGVVSVDARGHGSFSEHEVRALDVSENLVEFLVQEYRLLEEEDLLFCQVAACLGNPFKLQDVCDVDGLSYGTAQSACARLRRRGLLAPRSPANPEDARVKFHHDRVQQAALATMSANERAGLEGRIGRVLVEAAESSGSDEGLYRIVGHLNRARPQLQAAELELLCELNLRAAELALREGAEAAAYGYAQAATENASSSWCEQNYEFALRLCKVRATAEYLSGDLEAAEVTIAAALEQPVRVLDRADLVVLSLVVFTVAAKYRQGLDLGLRTLEQFGTSLTPDDGELLKRDLELRPIVEIVDREPMSEPVSIASARVLASMLPLTFLGDPPLFPLVVTRAVRLALGDGPVPQSAHAIAAYGILLVLEERYPEAYQFGLSAVQLAVRFDDPSQRCKAGQIFAAHISHWMAPLADTVGLSDEAHRAGLEAGDQQYARYTRLYDAVNRFYAGHGLDALIPFCEQHLLEAVQGGCLITSDMLEGELRVLRALQNAAPLAADEGYLDACARHESTLASCIYLIMKAELLFRRGAPELALQALERASPQLAAAPGVIVNGAHRFYRALSNIAVAARTDGTARDECLHSAQADARALASWAGHSAVNFKHQALLIEAELKRLDGPPLAALLAYEEAIKAARIAEVDKDEALAFSLYSAYARSLGLTVQSDEFEQVAGRLTTAWRGGTASSDGPASTAEERAEEPTRELDVALRADRAFATSLRLEELLQEVASTAMVQGGASRCVLLLGGTTAEELRIGAVCTLAGPLPNTELPPLSEAVPAGMVRYVARMGRSMLLKANDMTSTFARDPYLIDHRPAAILAVPLRHKGVVRGVIVLESGDLNAFTESRRRLLEQLCAQAAVSLENSMLFENLRREIEARQQTEEILRVDRERFASVLDIAGEGILSVDDEQKIVLFNQQAEEIFGYSTEEIIGQPLASLLPLDFRTPHDKLISDFAGKPSAAGSRRKVVEGFALRRGGKQFPVRVAISKVRVADGQLFTAVVHDLTQAREVELQRELLMRELDHRVKNNLAVNISLMNVTARSTTSISDFVDTFGERLRSVGRVHAMLANQAWGAIPLHELVASGLAPFAADNRSVIAGPLVMLPAMDVQALGTVVHELVTNAAKYGALSTATGTVRVCWETASDGSVVIEWAEEGGPPVEGVEPGTGMQLVHGLIEHQISGSADWSRTPTGLRWELRLPPPSEKLNSST